MEETPGQDHGIEMPATAETAAEPPVTAATQAAHAPEGSGESSSSAAGAPGLLAQVQHLIEQVLSAPVTREFAAKAAELAALAAEKAGPAARSIGARTEVISQSVAERATTFASSMRNEGDATPDAAADGTTSDSEGAG